MTDTDHSGADPRPPLEEFIRLTSEPGCSWGMADSDVVEICEYALRLETRLAAIRKETIEILLKHIAYQSDDRCCDSCNCMALRAGIAELRALAGGRDV